MVNERPINERFLEIERKLTDPHILLELGKANNLPFFIFDYDPKQELFVREEVLKLKKNNPNIHEFDLFNIIVVLLKQEGYLDTVKSYEDQYDSDYFAEFLREMRKRNDADCYHKFFKLGRCLNQRDTMAVNKTISAMCKLLYPDDKYTKENIEEILQYALEGRRRVKEQLKKLGGMEFYDTQFSYIDLETMEEKFVSVKEQGGGKLVPEGQSSAGTVYAICNNSNTIGVARIECSLNEKGNGKFDVTGLSSSKELKESMKTSQNYFKANAKHISQTISLDTKDYLMHVDDCMGIGIDSSLSLASYISYISVALGRPITSQMIVLGSMTIGGTISKVEDLANALQVCFDAGAKKILLPMSNAADIATVPSELFAKFQTSFYTSPEDAAIKALGIE